MMEAMEADSIDGQLTQWNSASRDIVNSSRLIVGVSSA